MVIILGSLKSFSELHHWVGYAAVLLFHLGRMTLSVATAPDQELEMIMNARQKSRRKKTAAS